MVGWAEVEQFCSWGGLLKGLNWNNSVRGEAQVEQFCSWGGLLGGLNKFKKIKNKKKCQTQKFSERGQVEQK